MSEGAGMRERPTRRGEGGTSLVEVLIAFFILLVVSLGVLQLFSMATAVNLGAQARTDLTARAQRVIEVVRLQDGLSRMDPPSNNETCCPLTTGTTYDLPLSGDCYDTLWGPDALAIITADAPFDLSYSVVAGGVGRVVTVTARPRAGGRTYLGSAVATKAVQYVAQF